MRFETGTKHARSFYSPRLTTDVKAILGYLISILGKCPPSSGEPETENMKTPLHPRRIRLNWKARLEITHVGTFPRGTLVGLSATDTRAGLRIAGGC